MNLRAIYSCFFFALLLTATAFAEPKLTLYVPFDGGINAKIAGGNPQGKFAPGETPQFSSGISGQGLLTGGSNQNVTFDAAGNISPDQWTITFWMKGLPGAQWNGGKYLQGFWALTGIEGEIMWFYRYTGRNSPWLFSRPKKGQGDAHWLLAPAASEKDWHYWAVSWRKGNGAYLYLDGQLVGQSPCQPPDPVTSISIGQPANPSEQNKIIDEFKIYDTAMDSGAIARQYWQEGNFALQPTITVTPTKQKIIIDGKIDPSEWQNAASFTGLLDRQSWSLEAPQTWVKMTYDNQNLYLAMHSDNPAEISDHPDTTAQHGFLKKDTVQHDGDVKSDDSFFFQIMPKPADGNLYTLYTNGIGTVYDAEQNKAENENSSWESQAQIKSISDTDGWSLEAAIPFKSLGVGEIPDGTSWHMNFGRIWEMLRQRTDIWAQGQRDGEGEISPESGLGTVNFSRMPDAVVNLQQFNIAPDGNVSAALNLYNPGTMAHELNVTLSAADSPLQSQQVLLQPNQQQKVTLAAIPQNADGSLISITVQSGKNVLFHQSAPLILERVGQLALWNYPSLQQIRLGWVIQSVSNPAMLSLDAQLKDANGKVLQNVTLAHLPSLSGSTLMDVKSLAPGKYILEAQVKDGSNVLQQQTLPYEKKILPSWVGNSLGISDTPPPPWTDVKVAKDNDAVSVWGRTYHYGGNLFPTQIINQGAPMLAAPMQIAIQTAGGAGQSSDSAKATVQWIKTTATRADSLRSQDLGPVTLTADSYVDFDGMTWTDLAVLPNTPQAHLNRLTIEIPLKADWAKLIRPYDDYQVKQTGALPGSGWQGNASSMPWVGNGNGGIQFFQETTASWIGSKTTEVVPDGHGTVVLRVHLIDTPATLDKPMHFAFGWMVSPVKPAPKNHRDWRLMSPTPANDPTVNSYVQQATALNQNLTFYSPWWEGWWWLPEANYKGNYDFTGPVPVPSGNGRENAVTKYNGIPFYGAPYGRLSEMGTANQWFAQFGDEWVPNTIKFVPDTAVSPALQSTTVSQASRSLRDFYAWGYNQLLNQGNVHALYFDVSRPVSDTNIYHGAGTVIPDGSIEPSRSILGMRHMFERIYTLMKEKHPDGKIFYHMSGEIMLPVDSFSDAMIDGENYTGLLDRQDNRGYENSLSVDQFRAEYSAQNNFGPATVFLPEFERAKSIMPDEWKTLGYQHADYLLGLVLLHDSSIWWTYMPYSHLAQVYSAFDATGWNEKWSFTPYWQQKELSLPQGVYASLYQSPDSGKILWVIMNTSGKDQNVTLPLTLDKNTFKSAKTIYPYQPVDVQNGKISTIHIVNNDFSAVVLEK